VFGAEGVGDLVHDGVGAAVTRGVCGVQVKAYLTVLDGGRTAADADDAGDGKGIALRVYVVGLGIDEDAGLVTGHGHAVVAGIDGVVVGGDVDGDGGGILGALGIGDFVHDGGGAGEAGVVVITDQPVLDGGGTRADTDN